MRTQISYQGSTNIVTVLSSLSTSSTQQCPWRIPAALPVARVSEAERMTIDRPTLNRGVQKYVPRQTGVLSRQDGGGRGTCFRGFCTPGWSRRMTVDLRQEKPQQSSGADLSVQLDLCRVQSSRLVRRRGRVSTKGNGVTRQTNQQ